MIVIIHVAAKNFANYPFLIPFQTKGKQCSSINLNWIDYFLAINIRLFSE